jgi:hypothetical protein
MKVKKPLVLTLLAMLLSSTFACAGGDQKKTLEPEWSRTFGGPDSDGGESVQQASDGGFVIAGYTWSFGAGGEDVYLIKADASGNEDFGDHLIHRLPASF